MAWRIFIHGTQKPITLPPGEQIFLAPTGPSQGASCVAVATASRPWRLALLVHSTRGVAFRGRKVLCPVIAVDANGGKLTARTREGVVEMTFSFSMALSHAQKIICCLCRMPLIKSEPSRQCSRCETVCHAECLRGSTCCPACHSPSLSRNIGVDS